MEKNSKFSLIVISLIFACMVITIFIQKIRASFDNPVMTVILGSAPSFLYTFGMLLICLLLVKREPEKSFVYVTLGSLAYEISQIASSQQKTFDYVDISFIVMAFILFTLLIKKSGYLLNLKESATKKAED